MASTAEIKQAIKEPKEAEYIQKLIDKGYINNDKEVITDNLNTVATFLSMQCDIKVTAEIMRQFINKSTGRAYSEKAIKAAVASS